MRSSTPSEGCALQPCTSSKSSSTMGAGAAARTSTASASMRSYRSGDVAARTGPSPRTEGADDANAAGSDVDGVGGGSVRLQGGGEAGRPEDGGARDCGC